MQGEKTHTRKGVHAAACGGTGGVAHLLVLLLLGPRRHVAPEAVRHLPARAVASHAAAWINKNTKPQFGDKSRKNQFLNFFHVFLIQLVRFTCKLRKRVPSVSVTSL